MIWDVELTLLVLRLVSQWFEKRNHAGSDAQMCLKQCKYQVFHEVSLFWLVGSLGILWEAFGGHFGSFLDDFGKHFGGFGGSWKQFEISMIFGVPQDPGYLPI